MANYELSDKEKARLAAETALSSSTRDAANWVAMNRRNAEKAFKDPISNVITTGHVVASGIAPEIIESPESLAAEFSSGNFIFHSSPTEDVIEIFKSGKLANLVAVNRDRKAQAELDGTLDEFEELGGNSGDEGISWSLNEIDAMPGNRYHVAGFLASPELVLNDTDKFCVPSRPAPNEVLQVPKTVNTVQLYDRKIQWELLFTMKPWDENNSVADGLIRFKIGLDKEAEVQQPSNLRDFYDNELSSADDISQVSELLRQYAKYENRQVVFHPSLLEQNDVLVSAVWLQCLVDNNRFEGTPLAGLDLKQTIAGMENGHYNIVFEEYKHARDELKAALMVNLETFDRVEVPVSELYFVCPNQDVNLWQTVIAQMEVKPKGIVVYDGTQIRLENFASKTEGHNQELTSVIRSVVGEGDDRRLVWDQDVLGTPFDDSMRRGYANQCVGSEFIGNSKILTSNGSDLKITDPHLGTQLTL